MHASTLNVAMTEANDKVREANLTLAEHNSQRLVNDSIRRLAGIRWMLIIDTLPRRERKPVDVALGHYGINSGLRPRVLATDLEPAVPEGSGCAAARSQTRYREGTSSG